MKELYIMRHGKSDWSDPGLADFDRPLKKRGRKNTVAVAKWLIGTENVPEHIWVSGAVRALATEDILIECMGEISVARDTWLYEASESEILEQLKSMDDDYNRLMIIGHNPVLEGLVSLLTSTGLYKIQLKTAAIVKIEFEIDSWQDIEPGQGIQAFHLHPRLLNTTK